VGTARTLYAKLASGTNYLKKKEKESTLKTYFMFLEASGSFRYKTDQKLPRKNMFT